MAADSRSTYERADAIKPEEITVKPDFGWEPSDTTAHDQHKRLPIFDPMHAVPAPQSRVVFQFQDVLKSAKVEVLELGVEKGVEILDQLKASMIDKIAVNPNAQQWVMKFGGYTHGKANDLKRQAVKTRTIIGVVGHTGAGKSSVINAILDHERLVPTSCFRACTAVVNEISYNHEEIPYRAEVEFIQPTDWEKELKTLFQDLLDSNGKISRQCTNDETEAGIAYAKIKAVYPKKTKDDIANSSIESMLHEVSEILGKTHHIDDSDCVQFYRRLQKFVEASGDRKQEKVKQEEVSYHTEREMEFWPLIKVVRLYVKAPVLSTGAVIVDLPGVHDSNVARAAVSDGYMKQTTGLWIVAPITRAIDDKAAKTLLGESFRRQLKLDGSLASVTFICSKTDDISLTEAQDSLGLEQHLGPLWQQQDELVQNIESLRMELASTKGARLAQSKVVHEIDDQLELWEGLRDDIENGKQVFAPVSEITNKRKGTEEQPSNRKKSRRSNDPMADSDHDSLDFDSQDDGVAREDSQAGANTQGQQPLTVEHISMKLTELRTTKRKARNSIGDLVKSIEAIYQKRDEATAAKAEIQSSIAKACISGRNAYSKLAIQQDYASGIKELDQELAAEEDISIFNPDEEVRDYDKVARGLPVFCVSSRGYQKLKGRLNKDGAVPGFKNIHETEIPMLQEKFLNNLWQLLNSLAIWTSTEVKGVRKTNKQKSIGQRILVESIGNLKTKLGKVVRDMAANLRYEFSDSIFGRFDSAIQGATRQAVVTVQKWASPANMLDRSAGGLSLNTYRAICCRDGTFKGTFGDYNWNRALSDPMMKVLIPGWEKAFSHGIPATMASVADSTAAALRDFHTEVENRARKSESGEAGLAMLQHQLGVYRVLFEGLVSSVKESISADQRDINRKFVPVIRAALGPAYEVCKQESGKQ
ncbi:MAG: hypothetical protein Q9224_003921, partial [Gallowayella concinna]